MQRFLETNIDEALEELRNGQKRSCWIWYVFPQLRGLGTSAASCYYGIKDLSEAREFLANETLKNRLYQCCELLLTHTDLSINDIIGSRLDAKKLQSSMTLFFMASETDNNIFGHIIDVFYDGELCADTIKLLKGNE